MTIAVSDLVRYPQSINTKFVLPELYAGDFRYRDWSEGTISIMTDAVD
uniref:Uncharacterized protein n=1 Tax=mine drainage metagenome TaxID=410659 RepID=E6PWN9_9ZZZZ